MKLLSVILFLMCSGQALAHRGLAELTLYDRAEGRRLPVYWHGGRAYVVGKPGNEYHVSLRNHLGEDLLAVVSVDGVNVITGESADPAQSGYVLGPRGSLDIRGWRKSLSETAAFYFTALSDSYAARTGRPQDVGVIGVALFRRKPPEHSLAPAEPHADAAAPRAERSLGTGHGRREHSPARRVAFERATQAPAHVLILYYDSYANLLARGVIRNPVQVAPLPRPFSGFVADPPG